MNNVLFTYRRKVKVVGGGEEDFAYNDNFVNPLNVISMYWSQNENKQRILSVWLVNNYSLVFTEQTGQRFVDHMEDFLRYMVGGRIEAPQSAQSPKQTRRTRTPISTDIIDEVTEAPGASPQWQA